jgi:PAS domain S-box-containing protein
VVEFWCKVMTNTQGQSTESAYRAIFEGAPVAIWDEDFSQVKAWLDSLKASGIRNVGEYLRESPEAIRACVQRVRVRHVNPVALEFYGAETEEQLMAALPSLFDDSALDIFRQELAALADGALSFTAEVPAATLSGERRRVVMNVRLVTPDDNWSRVVVTFTDITERRRLEQSLKRANETLRRLNRHLEQFAYAAAHDMREPLRTIALYAQLVRRHHPPEPGTRQEIALQYILENARRMETLVGDLLTFARAVESPTLEPERCLTDAQTSVAEVLSFLAGAVQRSSANIQVQSTLPLINMQPVHFRQVVQNLLSNAIKYRSPDRQVEIRITAQAVDGNTIFCIADNGVGIHRDYHEQIFGIFKRLHGYEIEGNGIGLALCRNIIEDYGGRVWVESEPDLGSRFYFSIPRTTDQI